MSWDAPPLSPAAQEFYASRRPRTRPRRRYVERSWDALTDACWHARRWARGFCTFL